MDDLISRQAAIKEVGYYFVHSEGKMLFAEKALKELPSAQQWIPVSERLPENFEEVNITWINHDPEPYYASVKDVPSVASGVYYNGRWYWWSAVCADYLREYGNCLMDTMDDSIEVMAWMPLPEPYKEEKKMTDIKALIEELEVQYEAWGKQYTFAMIIRDIEKFAAGGDEDAEHEDG